MSQETTAFTAIEEQDWEAALGLFDPAVEWSPTEGTFHGLEGLATSLMEWLEPWEEHRIEAEEFTQAGDTSWRRHPLSDAQREVGWRSTSASFRSTP